MVGGLKGLDGQGGAESVHLLGVEVGNANVADLACGHQLGQSAGRLFERRLGVWPVYLVEIDVIAIECPEALVDPMADPLCAGVALHPHAGARAKAPFGGDDHLIPRVPLQSDLLHDCS